MKYGRDFHDFGVGKVCLNGTHQKVLAIEGKK